MEDLGERFLTEAFELFDVGPTFPKTEIISVQCRGGRNSALWIIDHNGEHYLGVYRFQNVIIERHDSIRT